jgi:hypothetical protein
MELHARTCIVDRYFMCLEELIPHDTIQTCETKILYFCCIRDIATQFLLWTKLLQSEISNSFFIVAQAGNFQSSSGVQFLASWATTFVIGCPIL